MQDEQKPYAPLILIVILGLAIPLALYTLGYFLRTERYSMGPGTQAIELRSELEILLYWPALYLEGVVTRETIVASYDEDGDGAADAWIVYDNNP